MWPCPAKSWTAGLIICLKKGHYVHLIEESIPNANKIINVLNVGLNDRSLIRKFTLIKSKVVCLNGRKLSDIESKDGKCRVIFPLIKIGLNIPI
ncbi:Uncharacterized protein HZ326_8184 [Fusarium oxysporum f. sp. albedinis]|nr:Uncharacterized protein HZ326_8184 [Fusarium oxysporum f. sp. albedinis]